VSPWPTCSEYATWAISRSEDGALGWAIDACFAATPGPWGRCDRLPDQFHGADAPPPATLTDNMDRLSESIIWLCLRLSRQPPWWDRGSLPAAGRHAPAPAAPRLRRPRRPARVPDSERQAATAAADRPLGSGPGGSSERACEDPARGVSDLGRGRRWARWFGRLPTQQCRDWTAEGLARLLADGTSAFDSGIGTRPATRAVEMLITLVRSRHPARGHISGAQTGLIGARRATPLRIHWTTLLAAAAVRA